MLREDPATYQTDNIYRDTRFSKDKTPFKTATGAHFAHQARAKDQSVPGFYIHLEPGECVGGGGIYHLHRCRKTKAQVPENLGPC